MLIRTTYLFPIPDYKPERIRVDILSEDTVPVEIHGSDHKAAAKGAAQSAELELREGLGSVATGAGPYSYVWETTDEPVAASVTYANGVDRSPNPFRKQ